MKKAERNNSTECLEAHTATHTKHYGDVAVFREKGRLGILGMLGILKKMK